MARIPAVCNRCGTFFPSPLALAPGAKNVTLFGNEVRGGCPKCGGSGRVLDGTFEFIGNAIRLVSGPAQTIIDLERLAAILRAAQQRQAPIEEIQREVAAEVPGMLALVNLLPKTRAEGFAFYIPILVLIIQLAVAALQKGETPKITVEQVNNQVINQNITINQNFTILPQTPTTLKAPPRKPAKPPKSTVKAGKVGGNHSCPCGSGKKYKNCHLGKPL